ncbi:MAG TPA: ABC transporter permease [Patescibacteria group bacterium]|nr:ABC transporter permease [Patescibacteria group bacterium]
MFDLEQAIKKWKQKLAANPAMEEGYVAELEGHLRDRIEELASQGVAIEEAFRKVVHKMGKTDEIGGEFYKAHTVRLSGRPSWQPPRFMPALMWNYIKTALRKVRRQKGYTFINVFGLALGLACFILLSLWIRDEVNWDRFHINAKNLYRVQSGLIQQPGAIGPYVKANFPEIANSARLYFDKTRTIRRDNLVLEENGFVYADPSLFEMFTLPFVSGNRSSALAAPDAAVLSESAARKYFGNGNPIGQTLTVDNQYTVRVTGVVKNPPLNSDIRFEVLVPFQFIDKRWKNEDRSWGAHNHRTYVQLRPGADSQALIAKIAPLRRIMDQEPSAWLLTLVQLERIHLHEDNAIKSVIIFAIVSLFILVIAACNFVNLVTAKSGQRAKEIAVRKVAGAVRSQLVRQFLSESLILSLFAFLLSLLLVSSVLPSFNAMTGKDFVLKDLFAQGFFLLLLGTAAAIGLVAGAYPAILLSSFRPAGLLKGGSPQAGFQSGGSALRRVLVIVQFAISIVLVVSMLLVRKQVNFIRGYDLGVQKENVVILPVNKPLLKNRQAFVNELTGRPGILNATFASSFPSNKRQVFGVEWEGQDSSSDTVWQFIETDHRYLDTLGIKLHAGRNFPEAGPAERIAPYFIINQKGAAALGRENPVGMKITAYGTQGTVIGVVKDFHFKLLQEEIGPLFLFVGPFNLRYVLIKINTKNVGSNKILARIREVWERHAPGMPFSYYFLDAAYDQNYQPERQLGLEFSCFTLLGIFIACLGLLGLAAAMAEQKRKEIGIRKVFGATQLEILSHVIRQFAGPIVLANLIAWPLAFWAMSRWLQGFAYHTDLSLDLFMIAALSTLLIALLTVGFQAVRAARANPVDSLRYE